MIATCKFCEQEITDQDTPRAWVHTTSGDDGGTYDYCPDSPTDAHVPMSKTDRPSP